MKQKKNSFGRSMIEILAVLAIIAILSLGAILLIKKVFDKHAANTTLQEISLLAHIVEFDNTLIALNNNYSNISVKDLRKEKYTTTMALTKISNTRFAIHAYHLNKNICEQLLQNPLRTIDYVIANYSGNAQTAKCKASDNTVSFYFYLPLSEKSTYSQTPDVPEDIVIPGEGPAECTKEQDCTACQICQNGSCVNQCTVGQQCQNNECVTPSQSCENSCVGCALCQNGTCVDMNDHCPANQICTNGACACPSELPNWDGIMCVENECSVQTCTGCAECVNGVCTVRDSNCNNGQVCTLSKSGTISTGTCTCPPERPYWNGTECTCNPDSILIDDTCYSCQMQTSTFFNQSQCEQCSAYREWIQEANQCFLKCTGEQGDTFFRDTSYSCHRCLTSQIISATQSSCSVCDNRVWGEGNICRLACIEGQFMNNDGNCIDCQHVAGIQSPEDECQKCTGRTWYDGLCYSPCESENEFRGSDGTCNSCDANTAYETLQSQCDRCSDNATGARYWLEKDSKCYPAAADDYFLAQDAVGNLVTKSCNNSGSFTTDAAQCNKCIQSGYDRYYNEENKICYAPCVASGTGIQMRLANGSCKSCASLDGNGITISETQCNKCIENSALLDKQFVYLPNGSCAAQCTSGQFRTQLDYKCRSCSNDGSVNTTQNDCESCNFEGEQTARFFENGFCYYCAKTGNLSSISFEACKKCQRTDGKYMRYWTQSNTCKFCEQGSPDGLTCPE